MELTIRIDRKACISMSLGVSLLLFSIIFPVMAQVPEAIAGYQLTKEITLPPNSRLCKVDHMGDLYYLVENKIVKVYTSTSKTKEYKNLSLGEIYYYDVSNPLRILLFYKDMNTVVWLDNALAEITKPIKLTDLSIKAAEMVCHSVLNGFWVFDSFTGQISYIDKNLQVTAQTPSLVSIISPGSKPNSMVEKNNQLYVNIPTQGIFIFELNGAFQTIIPLINLLDFSIINRDVQYYNDKSIINYTISTKESYSIEITDTSSMLLHATSMNNSILLFYPNKISIHSKKK